ncbi:hypothetical protein BCR32DRAFT_126167 [Anaeromyces robustus]|uniref:Peptidase M13 N-terminal domain-containing protein n=1 Tax=Anaeromyces robustus TaxID=1754192 RepID=A0A1Y1VTT4_9FUNG|nr:hypothetical protein BCR32DRAFT_126167 [Anaeromyces robustus]|eukprot:ORX64698.1 hypothetical protein BCR32DRAFT_126167 [Anaeromyces robustus]
MKTNEIPNGEDSINNFTSISKNNLNLITEILNSEYEPNTNLTEEQQKVDKNTFTQIQNLFKTCIDTDTIDAKGKEPLIKFLKELNINNKEADYT